MNSVAPAADYNPTHVNSVAPVAVCNPTNAATVTDPLSNANSKIPINYKTTLARHLYKILQDSEYLKLYGKLRYSLKNIKNSESINKARYTKLNKLFENRVLQKYKSPDSRKTHDLCKKILVHEWGHHL